MEPLWRTCSTCQRDERPVARVRGVLGGPEAAPERLQRAPPPPPVGLGAAPLLLLLQRVWSRARGRVVVLWALWVRWRRGGEEAARRSTAPTPRTVEPSTVDQAVAHRIISSVPCPTLPASHKPCSALPASAAAGLNSKSLYKIGLQGPSPPPKNKTRPTAAAFGEQRAHTTDHHASPAALTVPSSVPWQTCGRPRHAPIGAPGLPPTRAMQRAQRQVGGAADGRPSGRRPHRPSRRLPSSMQGHPAGTGRPGPPKYKLEPMGPPAADSPPTAASSTAGAYVIASREGAAAAARAAWACSGPPRAQIWPDGPAGPGSGPSGASRGRWAVERGVGSSHMSGGAGAGQWCTFRRASAQSRLAAGPTPRAAGRALGLWRAYEDRSSSSLLLLGGAGPHSAPGGCSRAGARRGMPRGRGPSPPAPDRRSCSCASSFCGPPPATAAPLQPGPASFGPPLPPTTCC